MAFAIIGVSGPIISAKISGELGKSEVSQMQTAALEAIRRCGKISALFILEDFRGWKQEGDWGDISFLIEHDKDIGKIAVVGEEECRDLVYAFLAKGFRQAEVEYFLPADLPKARAWLEADSRPESTQDGIVHPVEAVPSTRFHHLIQFFDGQHEAMVKAGAGASALL